jgi:hypothetical protein
LKAPAALVVDGCYRLVGFILSTARGIILGQFAILAIFLGVLYIVEPPEGWLGRIGTGFVYGKTYPGFLALLSCFFGRFLRWRS